MRALVLGGTGMLGKARSRSIWRRGKRRCSPSIASTPTSPIVRSFAPGPDAFRPELIVNCAAFTAVDRCESERETAFAINGNAVANVVAAADRVGAGLIHLSSDYVFDGTAGVPYREDAATAPLSVYGKSKLRGEEEALRYPASPGGARELALRTGWSQLRHHHPPAAQRGQHSPLRVVDDQKGCPTYTPFLARALWDLAATGMRGIVHYCNRGAVSWHGFAAGDRALLVPGDTGTAGDQLGVSASGPAACLFRPRRQSLRNSPSAGGWNPGWPA